MNEKIKGKGSVGIAISFYSLRGMVSIPLEPLHEYNLIFDNNSNLFKIKVVSCSYKTKYGIFSASIRTSGGNQPNFKVKKFDQNSCDFVFIVTGEMDMYEIPSSCIESTRQISLNKYQQFQVNLIPS
jgi:hypothetical protein